MQNHLGLQLPGKAPFNPLAIAPVILVYMFVLDTSSVLVFIPTVYIIYDFHIPVFVYVPVLWTTLALDTSQITTNSFKWPTFVLLWQYYFDERTFCLSAKRNCQRLVQFDVYLIIFSSRAVLACLIFFTASMFPDRMAFVNWYACSADWCISPNTLISHG